MNQTYRRYISTQTITPTGVITSKIVAPKVNEEETAHERHARLAYQGSKKVNDARVKNLGSGSFLVSSQRKDSSGKPVTEYGVAWTGTMWLCQCEFGTHNPGVECAHVARVRAYCERNKLTFGVETVKAMRSESEAVTEQWISRAREARKARGRQELQEEL